MAIDFTLTSAQQRLQRNAREFATEILQPLVKGADEEADTQKAFQIIKGAYIECHKLGFAMGFLPKQYGGGGVSNLDLQIVAEEITAVDPGFATILLVNGLALMPVAWFGSEEQKRKWIGEATSDPRGEYLAGWTVSEAAGTPGAPPTLIIRAPRRTASDSLPGMTKAAESTCSAAPNTGRAMPGVGT
jgi:alkylation response protein AidB-like acyl-CoA dehydrogenase